MKKPEAECFPLLLGTQKRLVMDQLVQQVAHLDLLVLHCNPPFFLLGASPSMVLVDEVEHRLHVLLLDVPGGQSVLIHGEDKPAAGRAGIADLLGVVQALLLGVGVVKRKGNARLHRVVVPDSPD